MRQRLRPVRVPLVLLAIAAPFAAIAVNAAAGGYIDAYHSIELGTNEKGTAITNVTWACGKIGFATRRTLRHPIKITKKATFSAPKMPMTAETTAADGTVKKVAVKVAMKGYFGGVGAPANGTLSTKLCNHGKKQKFAAYPANI